MTNERIKIKIAESLGFTRDERTAFGKHEPWWADQSGDLFFARELPNYPESLDACALFEATLTDYERGLYIWLLSMLTDARIHLAEGKTELEKMVFLVATAKAEQRCLAYLQTKGIDV